MSSPPRSGYTLPVFACAAAVAALRCLLDKGDRPNQVTLNLVNPDQTATLPIHQLAPLPDGAVLAITHSDPGDNLDLTRHTPIWAMVTWGSPDQGEPILLMGGEGLGRHHHQAGEPAIYGYARQLMHHHLIPWLPVGKTLRVTVILPEGRSLAARTSNAAFGVIDGLALLGTSGIAAPLSAPGQLDQARHTLARLATSYPVLVFCLGENGLDLALQLGIDPHCRLKTANWLGPLLLEAAERQLQGVLLLGYHGKLLKLAGGIFHTHHHLADGRQEILAACCAIQGVNLAVIQAVLQEPTVEAGLALLQKEGVAEGVYNHIVNRIDQRARDYVTALTGRSLRIGSMVFNRDRQIIATSPTGKTLLHQVLVD
ncbi:MAG: cobalt-precorrin-5B (C(1))-methyltransferase CbiD [Nodosilinea sp. LVE1205-7]|jgi:cobalt-precorrin-5B (C1)-methyltransferase